MQEKWHYKKLIYENIFEEDKQKTKRSKNFVLLKIQFR